MRTALSTTNFVLFLFLMLGVPTSVFACSCAERPTQDREFNSSENVFIGRIVESKAPTPREEDVLAGDSGFTVVVIEKVFKGSVTAGDRFTISNGDGVTCAYTLGQSFVGQTWLFYLGKPQPRFVYVPESGRWKDTKELTSSVSFCGRSGDVIKSRHDLAFLESYEKYKGKNRLSGRLMELGPDVPNVVGMRIKITGVHGTFTVRVNESGYFEIYDLPHGEYLVEFETPEGWKIGGRYHSGFTTYPNRFDNDGLSSNQRRVVMGEGHYTLDFSLELDSAN